MEETTETKVARLLREGLDEYGFGDVSAAIVAWKRVLELDPENADAADYIKSADRRKHPRPEKTDRAAQAETAAIADAHRLIDQGLHEEALDLLMSTADRNEFALEVEATVELVRSCLVKEYRAAVGDIAAVPVLAADPKQMAKFNLPPDAGFLISMMDGATDLESLISISGMDVFDALRTMKSLLESGIVRMQT